MRLLCLVALVLTPVVADGRPLPPPETLGEFTLVATGDIMMHESVKQAAAARGFGELFAAAAPILRAADLGFGNLETPVAPHAGRGTRAFVFNAPRELLPALQDAGFGLVLAANNHAYDQGVAGVAETVSNLQDAGLREVGAGRDRAEALAPVVIVKNGLRVGFLGCTARFNQDLNGDDPKAPYVAPADPASLTAAVTALSKEVDAVVVAIHWGNEYQADPAPEQIDLAKRLVDAGALVVLGSHPHVLQRIEVLPTPDGRTALVAYSLGNFISNQSRDYAAGAVPVETGDPRDGALLRLTLRKRRYAGGQIETELTSSEVFPLWTENNDLARKRGVKLPVDIHLVDLAKELASDREELSALVALTTPLSSPQKQRAMELQKRLELLSLRRNRIADRLGGDFMPPAP